MKWEQWNIWAKWYELNFTHPMISKRLLAISERSKEFNQEPYIVFDLVKPESYVDDFFIELLIHILPGLLLMIGVIVFIVLFAKEQEKLAMTSAIVALLLTICASFIKFKKAHPNKNYEQRQVKDLLGEVKVSHITAIPCTLEGEVIGRGDPGYIFNEDMTLKDESGIIFLDYNQPLFIINKIFALFKNKDNMNKTIKVKGWYRRSPVPYVEIKSYEIDGKEKKIFTYPLALAMYVLAFILCFALLFFVN